MLKKIKDSFLSITLLFSILLAQGSSQSEKGKSSLKGEELLDSLQYSDYALIKTTRGDIIAKLFSEDAPSNVWLFKGLASGGYGWVNLEGDIQTDRYYDGQRIREVVKNRWFLFASKMGANYHWAGYDVQDEIFRRTKELKDTTIINSEYYAGLVWGNYILPIHDRDGFKDNSKLKAFYDAVLDRRNYKPLYGKTIGSFKTLSGIKTPIYDRERIKEPKKGDLFLFNIGVDTAYGVAGIYTANPTSNDDKGYTVIGSVVEGMGVVDEINNMNRSRDNIQIISVTFHETQQEAKAFSQKK